MAISKAKNLQMIKEYFKAREQYRVTSVCWQDDKIVTAYTYVSGMIVKFYRCEQTNQMFVTL